jgi:hypothetical protein
VQLSNSVVGNPNFTSLSNKLPVGDRSYHSPNLAERLGDQGLHLLTPYKASKIEAALASLWCRSDARTRR